MSLTTQSDRTSAKEISTNQAYSGSLYAPGKSSDADWFKFTLDEASRVSLRFDCPVVPRFSGGYYGRYTQAQLYREGEDGASYTWSIYGSKKWASKGGVYLPKGTYYVRLDATSGLNTWGQDYTFRVEAKAMARIETEPNGKRETCDSIAVNKAYSGSLYAPGKSSDADWFKFTLDEASRVSLRFDCPVVPRFSGGYYGRYTQARVYSARTLERTNGSDYTWNIYGSKKWASKGGVYLPKGTYYVRLDATSGLNTWGKDYALRVEAKAMARIETEPNGKRETCDSIAVNKAYSGSLYAPGKSSDADWFKFTLDEASRVSLRFDCPVVPRVYFGSYTQARIYSARTLERTNGSDYKWDISGSKKWASKEVYLPKGTYYVRLDATSRLNTWGKDYALRVQALS